MMPGRFVWYRASLIAASVASVPELAKNVRTSPVDRHDRRELLGQPHLWLVVEVRPRHVDELLRLLGDGLDHLRVADAGRVDGDAGGAVEKAIAVDVLDDRALATRDDERIVPGVGGRNVLAVAVDDGFGLGARQRRVNLRSLHPSISFSSA